MAKDVKETKEAKAKTLEEQLVRALRLRHKTISFAESCTAGAVASRLVKVPGASEVFGYGFVTYSCKAKHEILGVKKTTLKKVGAVSPKCARQMAKGCRKAAHADIAVSVTGLAGPDGGTDKTPVGTVFIGCSVPGKVRVLECHFEGDREQVREQAVTTALTLALEVLQKK